MASVTLPLWLVLLAGLLALIGLLDRLLVPSVRWFIRNTLSPATKACSASPRMYPDSLDPSSPCTNTKVAQSRGCACQ